jgi:hypothetical protein
VTPVVLPTSEAQKEDPIDVPAWAGNGSKAATRRGKRGATLPIRVNLLAMDED